MAAKRAAWSVANQRSTATVKAITCWRSSFMERPIPMAPAGMVKPCAATASIRPRSPHTKPLALGPPKYLPPKTTKSPAAAIRRMRSRG